jgi:DNA-binding response OmpR family regulator
VLLVDDEERMVAALRRGLRAEGFVVESATDGPAGLRLAQYGDFDAVVLDVMLPGLSGYEVVRRLRAHGNWVPVC